jgi:hypothetical protein
MGVIVEKRLLNQTEFSIFDSHQKVVRLARNKH